MDDLRNCPNNFIAYRTAESLLNDLKNNKIKYIHTLSLDHDMGVDLNGNLIMSGSDFVKELVYLLMDSDLKIDFIQFHTSNTVGFQYMQSTLNQAQKRKFIDSNIVISNTLTDYLKDFKF